MIQRAHEVNVLKNLLAANPIVAILGPRQVGKTTLARMLWKASAKRGAYFDLEDPQHISKLEDPMLALKDLKGLVIIDEIQRRPELFPVLRVLADRPRLPARFLVSGSASPSLLQQGSESLAGRIAYHYIDGFRLDELPHKAMEQLWVRGGFPKSYLARTASLSYTWRQGFISTFLERDLPQLGVKVSAQTLRRFWSMAAHYHGQICNFSELGRSLGVADTTVRSYLDILTSALMLRQLQPWHENIGKRQVKSPKIYWKDSGILHAFLNVRSKEDLLAHPKGGASWEGFILEQVLAITEAQPEESYFWSTQAGAELDLLLIRGRKRYGIEIKMTSAPRVTPSMKIAMKDLNLAKLDVIYAGEETYPLAKGIRAVGASQILKEISLSTT